MILTFKITTQAYYQYHAEKKTLKKQGCGLNKAKAYMEKTGDAGDISPPIFWIFRQILG